MLDVLVDYAHSELVAYAEYDSDTECFRPRDQGRPAEQGDAYLVLMASGSGPWRFVLSHR